MTIKYHNGSSWADFQWKYHNGSSWVEPIVKYYNGSAWVIISGVAFDLTVGFSSLPAEKWGWESGYGSASPQPLQGFDIVGVYTDFADAADDGLVVHVEGSGVVPSDLFTSIEIDGTTYLRSASSTVIVGVLGRKWTWNLASTDPTFGPFNQGTDVPVKFNI